jgi:catechol 2,3-dioxygenase-like lactoylglutathione lyase family enzyme
MIFVGLVRHSREPAFFPKTGSFGFWEAQHSIGRAEIAGGNELSKVGYVCVGTNDFDRALNFYDAFLGELGGNRLMSTPVGLLYRLGASAMIMITRPHDGKPATIGNGSMLAIQLDHPEEVANAHAKALELGATCEGEPGPRGTFGEFAYFRDLDGNKLAVFCPATR